MVERRSVDEFDVPFLGIFELDGVGRGSEGCWESG